MNFTQAIKFSVLRELSKARKAEKSGFWAAQFSHYENAHILGQGSTYWHTYTHWLMLCWGWQHRAYPEVAGQIFRIVGAVTKTAIGLLPQGNTGGANVSPFKPMALSRAHKRAILSAKRKMVRER